MQSRVVSAIVALAVLVLCTSCLGRPEGVESAIPFPGPTLTSTPTATPTPVAEAISPSGYIRPDPILDGDCTALFSDEDIAQVVGEPVPLNTERETDGSQLERVISDAGGFHCSWYSEDTPGISLIVLPAALPLALEDQACGAFTRGEGMGNTDMCLVDSVASDLRIGGSVYTTDRVVSRQIADRLIARFARNAAALGDVAPPVVDGLWPSSPDCEKLGPLEVDGADATIYTGYAGTDASFLPIEEAIMGGAGNADGCWISAPSDIGKADATFYTGPAWRFDDAIDTVPGFTELTELTVPGFDRALKTQYAYLLLRGPNLLTIAVYERDGKLPDALQIAGTIADRLDGLAAD